MKEIRIITLLVLVLVTLACGGSAFAQSSKKKNKKEKRQNNQSAYQPSSVNPSYPEFEYSPKRSKVASRGITYSAEERFHERMKEVAKQKRKAAIEMMKPQYSDFRYFGHKRIPKRNKPDKMKFCKECGIRH